MKILRNMKLGKKKTEGIEELKKKFVAHGMWSTGYQLDNITKSIAEVLGKTKVHINFPESNFNCHGEAIKVAKDVKGLMPFSNSPISFYEVTTLFYGDKHITRNNYLPFLADVDCFYISNIDTSGSSWVTVNLVKGPSWRTYL